VYYQIINLNGKYSGIVWQYQASNPQLERVFLPCGQAKIIAQITN